MWWPVQGFDPTTYRPSSQPGEYKTAHWEATWLLVWLCSRRWRQSLSFWHQHRTQITLACVFMTKFREYFTNINFLPPSTGTATGEEGWKHHKRNKDISFFPKLICHICDCRTQYILFTFYVVTVISKNITKECVCRQDNVINQNKTKKPYPKIHKQSSLIIKEAEKGRTTRGVTRNTCSPEYHSEDFTGSKSLIVGLFFCFKTSTR